MSKSPALTGGPDFGSLAHAIGFAVALASALNIYVFAFSPPDVLAPGEGYWIRSPAGWVIGVVWIGLFAMMGAARWRLISIESAAARRAAAWTTGLLLLCAAYPVYTFGLRSAEIGFVGNLATLGLAVHAARTSARVDRLSALAPAATAGWLIFATLLIADQTRWFW